MPRIVPETRPRLGYGELMDRLGRAGYQVDQDMDPVIVVGIRGYYRDTMGQPGQNDRGIYDDAIFLVSRNFFGSYNGNTDPSRYRPGRGRGAEKGMASLEPGFWRAHRLGKHKGIYVALVQTGGEVTVMRDGHDGPYPDRGKFGINIHSGAWASTSSEGCQTIYPRQWEGFISSVTDLAGRHFGTKAGTTTIPYILIDHDARA